MAEDGDDGGDGGGADGMAVGGVGGSKATAEEMLRVKQIVLELDGAISRLPLERRKGGGGNGGGGGEPRYVRPGYGLRELLGTCSVTQDNVAALVQKCEQCVGQLSEAMRFGVSSGSTFQLQKIADALRVAFDEERPSNEYRLCVQELPERDRQRNGNGGKEVRTLDIPRTLGYWCFHSGGAMKQLIEMGVRSILLTSGTLSPLSSFADELGIPFPYLTDWRTLMSSNRSISYL